ncbi:hypothetical protein [Catelliglobosispora koreensis]|uniref:hypothetical protein n=1 Tax=Catelliglobosispora koreensis TaxID=129052 RepID=UPI0003689B0E|nr:hypothetical protein [Catelliglobosispora koreensis]
MPGTAEAIRGKSQDSDLFLARLMVHLNASLGKAGYGEAFRRGAAIPRQAALERLAVLAAP